jgi:mono/diheme cytochrome c family protein
MKRFLLFCRFPLTIAFLVLMANSGIASYQSGTKQASAIPDSLNKIFRTSCISCHGNNGELLSKSLLNFDKWKDYSSSKKAEKAAFICKKLTKGEMPPKMVRESHPELVPSSEQIAKICKWAESLKAAEAKK